MNKYDIREIARLDHPSGEVVVVQVYCPAFEFQAHYVDNFDGKEYGIATVHVWRGDTGTALRELRRKLVAGLINHPVDVPPLRSIRSSRPVVNPVGKPIEEEEDETQREE